MKVNRLRILHVVEATTAGVRRYVTALAVGLRARGMDMAVAAPWQRRENYGDTAFVEDLKRHSVPFYPVPMQRRIGLWDASAFSALCRLLQGGCFTLVHTHSSKGGFLGRMAARRCHVPVAHTPNGLYFLEKTGIGRQFYLDLERLAGRLAIAMVAVSDGEKDVLVRNHIVTPTRIRVIHNGVDIARIDQEVRLTNAEAKLRLGLHPDRRVRIDHTGECGGYHRPSPDQAPIAGQLAAVAHPAAHAGLDDRRAPPHPVVHARQAR